jgi:hypothetical protein
MVVAEAIRTSCIGFSASMPYHSCAFSGDT